MAAKWGIQRADRLKKLADNIDILIEKDDLKSRHAEQIDEMRRQAACGLHTVCAKFVENINALLSRTQVFLDPPEYAPESFRPGDPNLLQINVRGRILQIEFEAPDQLVSTEHFRVPYILEGAVRSFNQELLERDSIEEQLLFYCLEGNRKAWRYFDGRTYQTGLFEQEYLVSLMERIL